MVVYNGTGPWDVATDLGSLIGDLDPSAELYRPQLRYLLVDEARYSREQLAEMANPVAELFRIETSRDWEEVRASVRRLRRTVPPDEESLRRAFLIWFQKVVLPRLGLSREEASEISTLEEVDTVLTESIDRWGNEIREEALQEGLQKGRLEGRLEGRQEGRQEGEARVLLQLLRLKFGSLAPEVEERVRSTDADRLLKWSGRVLTAESLEEVFQD
jgi:flagellar biosynthesis/type III secretory pathway protein FliH